MFQGAKEEGGGKANAAEKNICGPVPVEGDAKKQEKKMRNDQSSCCGSVG